MYTCIYIYIYIYTRIVCTNNKVSCIHEVLGLSLAIGLCRW